MNFNEQVAIDLKTRQQAICEFELSHDRIGTPHSFKCQFDGQCKNCNLQNIHTPFELSSQIVGKLKEFAGELGNKDILAFNLEIVEALVYEYGVSKDRIWFLTDCLAKAGLCSVLYKGVTVVKKDFFDFLNGKPSRKFDCVIMNPPYQSPVKKSDSLWKSFVEKALVLCKDNGFIVAIHPSSWRKPGHDLYEEFRCRQLKYLEIHNQSDGIRDFGCGTRYDWYILQNKTNSHDKSIIIDEDGNVAKVDISEIDFIPNKHSETLIRCLAKTGEERIRVIHARSLYGHDKPWMAREKNDTYKFPCVCSTPCNNSPKFLYSSKNDGHFGIKKVIIGKASPENCFYDNGEYGVSDNCIAIIVDKEDEAQNIIKAIQSEEFQRIINTCKWSGFSIEPEVFESLRKDFWKEFVK